MGGAPTLLSFSWVTKSNRKKMTQKPLVKDEEASDCGLSIILDPYLVTPKTSTHLMLFKRIFRSKGANHQLGLLVISTRVSSFTGKPYSDSDYARANLDKKSPTGEAEYVAAANCCGKFCGFKIKC
ncbi:hypothetical protein Tco_0296539 [Tanacetum coccineum]